MILLSSNLKSIAVVCLLRNSQVFYQPGLFNLPCEMVFRSPRLRDMGFLNNVEENLTLYECFEIFFQRIEGQDQVLTTLLTWISFDLFR